MMVRNYNKDKEKVLKIISDNSGMTTKTITKLFYDCPISKLQIKCVLRMLNKLRKEGKVFRQWGKVGDNNTWTLTWSPE